MLDRFLSRTEFDSYEDFIENYKVNVPTPFNFGFDVVDAWAEREPERKALVWCNDHGGERTFTFADIRRESNRIANMLRDKGIKRADRVLLILKRRYEYWLCAIALHKLGAVLIPGSVQLTQKDIIYRAEAANIRMIIAVAEDGVEQHIRAALPHSPTIHTTLLLDRAAGFECFEEELSKYDDVFVRQPGEENNEDIMLIYFTSGTTGMPKMAAHDYTYPLGHITTAKYWQEVGDQKLHLTVSDSGWAKFGWGKIYGQWISGAVIFAYDMDKFIPHKLLEMLERYKIYTFCAPPTIYRFLLQENLKDYDLSSVKHASTAGEPLNPEVFNQFRNATGLEIKEGFGQSESSVMLAAFPWIKPRVGSLGKCSPLYDIELIGDDGKPCSAGEEGEVVIKNAPLGLFRGYFEGGDLISPYKGGYYRTGDVAWRDPEGYYWFVGRSDDVIKCSGYRIGPFEVESAMLEHKAVLECAITAAPDPVRGQVVKATVVLKKGFSPGDDLAKELQAHVKKTTAPYKYPRIVEFVDELPKTLGGKIKRAQIRREDGEKA